MFDNLITDSQLFFLLYVRTIALLLTAPLFSSQAISSVVRFSLAFMITLLIFPTIGNSWYAIPDNGLQYVLLAVGEALIGIVTGLILSLIIAVFQLAGQIFSLQMGFGASQVFDPLAQIEIPLMGQFFNIMAIFILLLTAGFQRILFTGIIRSFQAVRATDFMLLNEPLVRVLLQRLSKLFEQAMVIAFPILGVLFLISVSIGLIAKATPQMNLLIIGFPFSIGVAFLMIIAILPFMVQVFEQIFDEGFRLISQLFDGVLGVQ